MSYQPTQAILVRELSYHYPDGRRALGGVNLTIAPGETVALVGPNGAGKSTFLLHLNGLLPGKERGRELHTHGLVPSNGKKAGATVWVEGLEVNERNGPEVRRRVGLLFQDPDDQLFSTTVLDDVAFGPRNLGKSRDEARRIARACLAEVGLHEAEARVPHHLSFGERKRVCLAGLLACEPSVLALDEPTANLDPRGRRHFLEIVRGLSATKLIATHDLEMVVALCERVVLLDGGRIIADGPTLPILSDEGLLEAHGLEVALSLKLGKRRGDHGVTEEVGPTKPRGGIGE